MSKQFEFTSNNVKKLKETLTKWENVVSCFVYSGLVNFSSKSSVRLSDEAPHNIPVHCYLHRHGLVITLEEKHIDDVCIALVIMCETLSFPYIICIKLG